ncbi:hypothetical protein B6V01_002685 [Methanosarcinales archaeon ex4572_44]|nr:MAG: hypothetical protein B6V01_002685 [Methanosarcinales archaeon ex4572_44]
MDEIDEKLLRLVQDGIMITSRPFEVVAEIGILANGMCVWNVPDHRVEEVGAIMAGFKEVTHCYERPRHPNWQYNIDYTILFSEREFKKTGVRL